MLHGQRRGRGGDPGKGRQRNLLARAVDEEEAAQRLRALQILGRGRHHHTVLVERVVDHAHLALAEGVVERVVDLRHRQAQARGLVAVYDQLRLHAVVLHIAVDIGQLRQRGQHLTDARLPQAQLGRIVGLQRVLIGGHALAPANAHIALGHHEQARTGFVLELFTQAVDDLVTRHLALGHGLERHEHIGRIGLAAAGKAGHILHRRVLLHHIENA